MKPPSVFLRALALTALVSLFGCSKNLEQEVESLRKENHRLVEEGAEAHTKGRMTEAALNEERERHASEIVTIREEMNHAIRLSESKVADLQKDLDDLREKFSVAASELAKKAAQLEDVSRQKQQSEDASRLRTKLADLDAAITLLQDVCDDTLLYHVTFDFGNPDHVASTRFLLGDAYANDLPRKAEAAEDSWRKRYCEGKTKLWELTKATLPREEVEALEKRIREIYEKLHVYFYSKAPFESRSIRDSIGAVRSEGDQVIAPLERISALAKNDFGSVKGS